MIHVPVENNNTEINVKVNWKAYSPVENLSGPGDVFSTVEDLAKETLSCLGDYYKVVNFMIERPSNIYFQIRYKRSLTESSVYTNAADKTVDELKALGKYCYVQGSSLSMDTNLDQPPAEMTVFAEASNPYETAITTRSSRSILLIRQTTPMRRTALLSTGCGSFISLG